MVTTSYSPPSGSLEEDLYTMNESSLLLNLQYIAVHGSIQREDPEKSGPDGKPLYETVREADKMSFPEFIKDYATREGLDPLALNLVTRRTPLLVCRILDREGLLTKERIENLYNSALHNIPLKVRDVFPFDTVKNMGKVLRDLIDRKLVAEANEGYELTGYGRKTIEDIWQNILPSVLTG